MSINPTSLAAAKVVGVRNEQRSTEPSTLPRKIALIGSFDSVVYTDIVEDKPIQVISPEQVGTKFGFGGMLHRLAYQSFKGSEGVETWVVPQKEDGADVAAVGSIEFIGVLTRFIGTVYIYIGGIPVLFSINGATSFEDIATLFASAVNGAKDLPVSAMVDGTVLTQVNLTSKTVGDWGNHITIKYDLGMYSSPTGLAFTIVDMVGGLGIPDIATALDGMGISGTDDANSKYWTDVSHGYGLDTKVLDSISAYVGEGDTFTGLYAKSVARPFRVLSADVQPGDAGLASITQLGDDRKLDRANGAVSIPGSPNIPSEISSYVMGIMARINNIRPEEMYVDIALSGIFSGVPLDRWSDTYDNRDLAVKSGVSPTRVSGGSLLLQNVITFYHPDDVAQDNNAYRSMRNISVIQNILSSQKSVFSSPRWMGVTVVSDVARIGNAASRDKVRDVNSVRGDIIILAKNLESRALLYSADPTIEKLKDPGAIQLRPGGDGFIISMYIVLSGEGNIYDTTLTLETLVLT